MRFILKHNQRVPSSTGQNVAFILTTADCACVSREIWHNNLLSYLPLCADENMSAVRAQLQVRLAKRNRCREMYSPIRRKTRTRAPSTNSLLQVQEEVNMHFRCRVWLRYAELTGTACLWTLSRQHPGILPVLAVFTSLTRSSTPIKCHSLQNVEVGYYTVEEEEGYG